MVPRIMLVFALAAVVGFGVAQVFDDRGTARQATQAGEQLDMALSGDAALVATERWYDNPATVGLIAGGAVLAIGIVLVIVTTVAPRAERSSD